MDRGAAVTAASNSSLSLAQPQASLSYAVSGDPVGKFEEVEANPCWERFEIKDFESEHTYRY